MPFELPALPSFQTNIPQFDPVAARTKMLQLKDLMAQQQLIPLQVQEAQQTIERQGIANQQADIALKTQQAENAYWSNPENFTTAAPAGGDQLAKMLGMADDDPLLGMVRGQMKAGVPGPVAIANAKSTLDYRKSVAQGTEEQQKVLTDAWSHLETIAAPILAEQNPEKKAELIRNAIPGLNQWAAFDPSLKPVIPQLNAQNFDAFANRLGAEKDALELRDKSADLWKKELENNESVDPLLKMQTNPSEAFSGDKLPASIAYLQSQVKSSDPKVAVRARSLLGMANAAKNQELAIDRSKKETAQAIADGDPVAAGKLLVDGTVAPSQIISARKPEFAQKAFSAAAQLAPGWSAQKAEADYSVAKSSGQVTFFGSAKSLTDKGGTLDQLADAAKDIPDNKIPVFNTLQDAIAAASGSGPIAKYAAIALGVADDYSKVMGGGQGSDAGRTQALNIFKPDQSPEQRQGVLEGVRGSVLSQTHSRIGNNSVLQRMYGDQLPAATKTVKIGGQSIPLKADGTFEYQGHTYKDNADGKGATLVK